MVAMIPRYKCFRNLARGSQPAFNGLSRNEIRARASDDDRGCTAWTKGERKLDRMMEVLGLPPRRRGNLPKKDDCCESCLAENRRCNEVEIYRCYRGYAEN